MPQWLKIDKAGLIANERFKIKNYFINMFCIPNILSVHSYLATKSHHIFSRPFRFNQAKPMVHFPCWILQKQYTKISKIEHQFQQSSEIVVMQWAFKIISNWANAVNSKNVIVTIKSKTIKQMCQLQVGQASKEEPHSFVFYDNESLSHQRCNICWLNQQPLIEPCQCGSKYHQLCLLRMVKEKMLDMRDKGKIEMSELKCRKSQTLFRLLIQQNTYYSCHYFCLDLKRDWTNKTAIFGLLLILLIIIGLAIIISNYSVQDGPIFYALLFAETMLILMFLVCLVIFGQSNFTYKELILMKIYEFSDFMKNNNTSSDEESPQHHIISDHLQIVVNGLA